VLRNLLTFSLIFCFAGLFSAQNKVNSETTETVDSLRKIFNAQRIYQLDFTGKSPVLLFHQIKNYRDTNFNSSFDYSKYYLAQKAYAKRQLGLNLRADALQNSQTLFTELEDNILYQRRYLIGLEWDLLKNGFSQRNTTLKTIELNEQITSIEQKNTVLLKSSLPRTACIAYFNNKKIKLLEARISTLKAYIPLLEKLFYSKEITLEDLYAIQSRLVETQEQLSIYKAYNENLNPYYTKNLFDYSAPIFEINDNIYFSNLNQTLQTDTASIRNLHDQMVEVDNKWYNELSLRAYSRMNVYDLYSPTNPYRSFFSFGLNFSMPLPFSHQQKSELDKQKWEKDHFRLVQSTNERLLEQTNNAYEYRFALKKLLLMDEKEKMVREAIRIERTKSQLAESDFSPIHGLKLLDDLAQIQIEQIEIRQILYLKLVDINEKNAPTITENWLIKLDKMKAEALPEINRNVYAWSKAFENKPAVLLAFAEYNRFEKIYIAVSKNDSLRNSKNEFVKLSKTTSMDVIPMIGQNKLLYETDFTNSLNQLLEPYKNWEFNEVHLDIEPHTQADWKENEEKAFANYLEKLKQSKAICSANGWKISISIPISYDSLKIHECLKIVDEIHFMCYENVKYSYLLRKLNAYKDFKDRIFIALRTEDFKNRHELEQFIILLQTNEGFTHFDYHDLSRLIKWDIDQLENEKR
jgi:hypothetical protein